jgi:predicted MFS family arabinose efflux permease
VVVFGVHAGVSGSFGPRVPAVKDHLGIDDGTLGVALTAMAVAMFAGTRVAGWATARMPPRVVIGAAVPVLCGGLVVAGRAPTLALLVAAMVAMGLAMGTLDVAMNAEAVDVEARGGRPVLGLLHGSWSAGLLLAGAVAALVTAAGWTLSTHLTVVAAVMAVAGLAATAALPRAEPAPAGHPPEPAIGVPAAGVPGGSSRSAVDRYRAVAVLGLVAGCSFAAEGAAIDWSAVYLRDAVGTTAALAAAGFVIFSAGMALSRFVADRMVTRWGPVPVVRLGGLAGALGMGLVVAWPTPAVVLAGLGVLGVALAPVVPVVFRAAGAGPGSEVAGAGPGSEVGGAGPGSEAGGRAAGAGADGHRQLAWVVTTAYLGTMLGPAVIGVVARLTQLRAALLVVVALALVIAALAARVAGGAVSRDRSVTTSGS